MITGKKNSSKQIIAKISVEEEFKNKNNDDEFQLKAETKTKKQQKR